MLSVLNQKITMWLLKPGNLGYTLVAYELELQIPGQCMH